MIRAGTKLASYVIQAPLGAGAMGEVWRARDTRLDREVAIKVLPDHFADDPERLKRFEREAKTLAALNHPNVAQIFGVDQIGDVCFLVLELVPGESIGEKLRRGPLALDEALDVCRQIAEGLEAAHEAGVIHRDLKPANVLLAPDGKVKLVDFGLARPARGERDGTTSTDSVLETEAGRVLGTPTYMAPEQARGKPIDRRVDIWAFGCVLYECLTGRRAFAGETLTDILASVLHTHPDLEALPAKTPRAVGELIARCFKKDPRMRLRDMGEARQVLERAVLPNAEEEPSAPRPIALARAWPVALLWAASLAAAVYVAVLVAGHPQTAPAPTVRTCINLPPDLLFREVDGSLALSPDGRTLALCGGSDEEHFQMWLRPLDSLKVQPLADTHGATYPFWSPDGRTIGFFADGQLKRIPASGGSVTTVCAAPDARGGTWTDRDEIVFSPAPFGGLFRVPAAGGVPVAITTIEGRATHRVPHALPGGRRVLFTQDSSEAKGIRLLDLDTGAVTEISADPSDAQYVAPGELLFVRSGHLMSQPFDLDSGRLTGQPRRVAEHVPFLEARLSGRYCASAEGTVIYQSTNETRLEWFDLEGRSLGRIGAPAEYEWVSVSPDGQRVMATIAGPEGGSGFWLIDGRSGLGTPRPDLKNTSGFAWSPDSQSIAYSGDDDDTTTWCVPLDGSSPPRRIGSGGPCNWSRDGNWIGVVRLLPGTGFDVAILRADGTGEAQIVAATPATELGGCFSPDNRWLGFGSNESGEFRMYLAPVGRPGPSRPFTSFGVGSVPAWLDDGRIVYQASTGELEELPVTFRGDEIEVGQPRRSFGGRKVPTALPGSLSIAQNGQRLLAIVAQNGTGEPPLVVVQHGLGGGGR